MQELINEWNKATTKEFKMKCKERKNKILKQFKYGDDRDTKSDCEKSYEKNKCKNVLEI